MHDSFGNYRSWGSTRWPDHFCMDNRFEKITDEKFIETFNVSTTRSDIQKRLGLPMNGTTFRFIDKTIERLNLDVNVLKSNYKKFFFIKKICPVCGTEFFTPRDKKNSKKITCSYACSNTYFRSGENNGMFRVTKDGNNYRNICFMNHPHKCCICGEENIVAVHHLDGNHNNNDPSNLIPLCPTHHVYIHSKYSYLIKDKIKEYTDNFKKQCGSTDKIG